MDSQEPIIDFSKDHLIKEISGLLSGVDLVVGPIILLLIILWAFLSRNKYNAFPEMRKYFMPGLLVRFLGLLLSILYYQFILGSGDVYDYWRAALNFRGAIIHEPIIGLELFTMSSHEEISDAGRAYSNWTFYMMKDVASVRVCQIGGLLALLTFGSYVGAGLLLAVFSFLGCWKLFEVFQDIYPSLSSKMAIACLFIPSVFFWGSSGLLKDTITTASLGFFVWSIYALFIKKRKRLRALVYILFSGYLLFTIKDYIFLVLTISSFIWLLYSFWINKRGLFIKTIIKPLLVISFISTISLIFVKNNEALNQKFSSTINTIAGAQWWMKYVGDKSGAGFTLGEYEKTIIGVLGIMPKAVSASLFRPSILEISSPLIFVFSIESAIFLLLFILMLVKTKIISIPKRIMADPNLVFCVCFTIGFAWLVGFTTFNFGALARYRIPCLPFYLISIFVLTARIPRPPSTLST